MARKITVLRGADVELTDCADGKKCPAIIEVEGMDDLVVISKPVTDPELIALLGNRLGPGETLHLFPRHLLPEVTS